MSVFEGGAMKYASEMFCVVGVINVVNVLRIIVGR
jgi:hypothetical protein